MARQDVELYVSKCLGELSKSHNELKKVSKESVMKFLDEYRKQDQNLLIPYYVDKLAVGPISSGPMKEKFTNLLLARSGKESDKISKAEAEFLFEVGQVDPSASVIISTIAAFIAKDGKVIIDDYQYSIITALLDTRKQNLGVDGAHNELAKIEQIAINAGKRETWEKLADNLSKEGCGLAIGAFKLDGLCKSYEEFKEANKKSGQSSSTKEVGGNADEQPRKVTKTLSELGFEVEKKVKPLKKVDIKDRRTTEFIGNITFNPPLSPINQGRGVLGTVVENDTSSSVTATSSTSTSRPRRGSMEQLDPLPESMLQDPGVKKQERPKSH